MIYKKKIGSSTVLQIISYEISDTDKWITKIQKYMCQLLLLCQPA